LISNIKHEVDSIHSLLIVDFQDSKSSYQVLAFALGHYQSLLGCLYKSIGNPITTKLAIQNITFLMRSHKQCRLYIGRNPVFIEWRQNPRNPLYSLENVEGILITGTESYTEDIFLSDIQQFIYYIGEANWPLPENIYTERVIDRFKRIWRTGEIGILPFPDQGERWFSDRESERSEEGDGEYDFDYEYEEWVETLGEDQSMSLLDDEPDIITPEDMRAYYHVAEEAGLRSQQRRRGARLQDTP
jgi:hypothetical protein